MACLECSSRIQGSQAGFKSQVVQVIKSVAHHQRAWAKPTVSSARDRSSGVPPMRLTRASRRCVSPAFHSQTLILTMCEDRTSPTRTFACVSTQHRRSLPLTKNASCSQVPSDAGSHACSTTCHKSLTFQLEHFNSSRNALHSPCSKAHT